MHMPTLFSVDSGRCGRESQVVAELMKGGKIKVTITSTCPEVKRYGENFKEVEIKDIAKPAPVNPIYTVAASSGVGPECLVPCAVVSATWTEAGMVSKNLLARFSTMCMKYEGIPENK